MTSAALKLWSLVDMSFMTLIMTILHNFNADNWKLTRILLKLFADNLDSVLTDMKGIWGKRIDGA